MTCVVDVIRGRLGRFLILGFFAYCAAAIVSGAPLLILILNDLLMSAAAGVCFAYAPVLPVALSSSHPVKGDYLGTGIFFVSLCMLLLRLTSMVARDFGYPEVYNSDVVTFALFLGLVGAFMHLWAPHVREGRVPPARWVSSGIVIAIGLFIGLVCWNFHVSHAVLLR